eukprot:jgi/Chlat1/2805/Chrsp187S00200
MGGGSHEEALAWREAVGRDVLDNFVIEQHVSICAAINYFYIIMLKRPAHEFIKAMFLVPAAFGLLFTPLYWLDVNGFKFEGDIGSSFASKLYTLILSTLNMLMALLTIVFLSVAVFSRLSQPTQPIKCARYAIINDEEELLGTQAEVDCPKWALSARLVLTGPMPNELIDVRVSLTCWRFLKTRDGGLIVDIQPLQLDAAFFLTIMCVAKTSMQQIFHWQEYLVTKRDVAWDADWVDMVSTCPDGRRVIDHSILNACIRVFKTPEMVRWANAHMAKVAESQRLQDNATDKGKSVKRL